LERFKDELKLATIEPPCDVALPREGGSFKADAVAYDLDGRKFIIEYRQHKTSRLAQEAMFALSYRVIESNSAGGFVVTPLPLQKGANLCAKANNILSIELGENSTPEEFSIKFLNKIFVGLVTRIGVSSSCTMEVIRK
jgi:hypothetical protein